MPDLHFSGFTEFPLLLMCLQASLADKILAIARRFTHYFGIPPSEVPAHLLTRGIRASPTKKEYQGSFGLPPVT